jgi:hypothetical protein
VEADFIMPLEGTVAEAFGFGADCSVFLFFLPSLPTKEPSKLSLFPVLVLMITYQD